MEISLPLTQREEHSVRVFENKVMMRIFGRETEEVCMMRSFFYASPNYY
jgi:hypothetical protein